MPESSATDPAGERTAGGPHHPVGPHHPAGPRALAAIAVGGALGTLARYAVERAVVPDPAGMPWATFAVNVVGSFILGVVLTVVVERRPDDRLLRPFAAVGFCGGFTTFSTFVLEIDRRIGHGHGAVAALYLAGSLVAGLLAAAAGTAAARGALVPAPAGSDLADPDVLDDEDPGAPGRTGGAGPR